MQRVLEMPHDERPEPPHVIIAEDEPIQAEVLSSLLGGMGFDVLTICSTSEDVIASCGQIRPDVVLMDICLGTEMDGIEAARRIVKRYDIPVIFLTAYTNRDLTERALVTTPYGYLLKPYNPRELKVAILAAIRLHAIDRELRTRSHLLETIIGSVSGAVIAIDGERVITYFNREAEQVTGVSSRMALRRPIDDVFLSVTDLGADGMELCPSTHRRLFDDPVSFVGERIPIKFRRYALKSDDQSSWGEVFTRPFDFEP